MERYVIISGLHSMRTDSSVAIQPLSGNLGLWLFPEGEFDAGWELSRLTYHTQSILS